MVDLRELEERIVTDGRVHTDELEFLRETLYADGKIDRREADFLAVLRKRLQFRSPAFEQFFRQAIKSHVLVDGRIGAADTAWLRQLVCTNGKIADEDRKLLHEVKGEARQASPEFEALFREVMQQPPGRRTAGG